MDRIDVGCQRMRWGEPWSSPGGWRRAGAPLATGNTREMSPRRLQLRTTTQASSSRRAAMKSSLRQAIVRQFGQSTRSAAGHDGSVWVSFCRQSPASVFREIGTDARISLEEPAS